MRRSVVVVGKPPRPGAAKTRLVPPLSAEEAADLYRAFLQDTVSMALGLGWEDVTLVHPADPGADAELRAQLPPGVRLTSQVGAGLGAALVGAFRSQLAAGFGQVLLIGSDSPSLPVQLLLAGARGLETHDLVIGPSSDGGYYLIGMTRPHIGVFERITWSTDAVFKQTMERGQELGLRTLVLAEWYDVDTEAELARLRDHLDSLSPRIAVATRTVLARLPRHDLA